MVCSFSAIHQGTFSAKFSGSAISAGLLKLQKYKLSFFHQICKAFVDSSKAIGIVVINWYTLRDGAYWVNRGIGPLRTISIFSSVPPEGGSLVNDTWAKPPWENVRSEFSSFCKLGYLTGLKEVLVQSVNLSLSVHQLTDRWSTKTTTCRDTKKPSKFRAGATIHFESMIAIRDTLCLLYTASVRTVSLQCAIHVNHEANLWEHENKNGRQVAAYQAS